MNGERCQQAPRAHGDRCPCGRRARWHVDCAIAGCGNYCGIHARAIQRRTLGSAVFNPPNIIKETPMELTPEKRALLEALADQTAETMAEEFGRARVTAPHYSAKYLAHGGWSVLIVGMTDDVERDAVEVFVDGTARPVAA